MRKVIDILKSVQAILTDDHFVGTSGKHLDTYVNKDALYPHTQEASEVCKLIAKKVKGLDFDTVVSPALGGIILSQWVAYHLTQMKGREIFGVFAEKDAEKNMIFTRGYDKYITGKKVLVVEDITNTGGSAKKVVEAVRAMGGQVVAVTVMVNRNPDNVNEQFFGSPFFPLEELKLGAYEEAECPMCKSGVPINTKVGHGKKYLESKKNAKV